MKNEHYLLGQPEAEVRAALTEEASEQCFGCPYATMRAAEIVHRTNMLLGFTDELQVVGSDFHTKTEEEVRNLRENLGILTINCNGYSETKRESGRPAKMCDSPESPDPKMSVVAGRILEYLRLA